jgi:hypothetical protein
LTGKASDEVARWFLRPQRGLELGRFVFVEARRAIEDVRPIISVE